MPPARPGTGREGVQGVLVLEDGAAFPGVLFGGAAAGGDEGAWGPVPLAVGEVVFNTGMTGYQEVLTDPSYAGQIVVMTYPLIGNYGTHDAEAESRRPWVRGFVVRETCEEPSHWGDRGGLDAYLRAHGICGLAGVDTRAVTRHLRRHGTLRGVLAAGTAGAEAVAALAAHARAWRPEGLVEEVTTPAPYVYSRGTPHVVLVDYGSKANIARSLAALGAGVTVVPAWTTAREILALRPDGVLLSNGPGDPRDVRGAPETIRELLAARVPIFGICLGHQLLGLALGGRTEKLPFGHRGVNHPVIDLRTGRGTITTQNHGYALVAGSLDPAEVEITHVHLHDGTVEGLRHRYLPAFSVQYHPEACPGPAESRQLFEEFLRMCRQVRTALPAAVR
jgi:carbamoyl-phosphate synthase small subunit